MKIFMVDRDLAGITLQGLAEAKEAANAKAASMRAEGSRIRYVRSTFLPGDGRCMCLFEADEEDEVRRLNDEAGLPYRAIVAAYDLTPEGIHGTEV
jgi:hypothetical protein